MLKVYCDGGCLRNGMKDPHSYGSFKVYSNDKLLKHEDKIPLKGGTNNQAEYDILIEVLKYLCELTVDSPEDVEIFTDSKLMQGQIVEGWKCNSYDLQDRRKKVQSLMKEIGSVSISYLPRFEIVKELGH